MTKKRTPDEINTEFAQITIQLGRLELEQEQIDERKLELYAVKKQLIKRVHELSKEMKEVEDDKSNKSE